MKMIFFFLFFIPGITSSQTFTIKDLLREAERHSPAIRGQSIGLSVSEAQLKQARLLSNPVFTFQGGTLRSGKDSGTVTDFTLNQPLPWPGRRSSRIEAQEFLMKLSELSKEEMLLEVSHRVLIAAAEVAALQELQDHYSERKRRFSLIEKSLKSRPLASPKQKVDRDLIESQMGLMEKEMIMIVARKEALLWELKILTQAKVDKVSFPWESFPVISKDEFLKHLEEGPRFRRLKIEKELSQNKILQAKLEARPDIMVGVNYRKENVAPVNHFYHGQVSVVIPIIDYGQHSVEAAKAEDRKREAFQELEVNQMTAEVHKLFVEYEASKKAMDVFRLKDLNRMETKFHDAEVSFRKGFIDALTFLQIDGQVHENIDQIYLTRLAHVEALSKLNLLIGKAPEF